MSATHNSGTVSSAAGNNSSSSLASAANGNTNNGGSGSRPGTPCSTASGEAGNNVKVLCME